MEGALFRKAALPAARPGSPGSCLQASLSHLPHSLKASRRAIRALASSVRHQDELPANPRTQPPHAFKMRETQRMSVDPAALPWAGWPSWRPLGRPQGNLTLTTDPAASGTQSTKPSVQAKDSLPPGTMPASQLSAPKAPPQQMAAATAGPNPLAHIQSDQPLLQAADALPSADAGMVTLRAAADLLQAGRTVAMPTETVYGLAGNALNSTAVASIYAAKGRPADNPLIVHVSSLEMLAGLYGPGWQLPEVYRAVVADAWPGPLTILLPRSPQVPDVATCGLDTMAVRMPAHPVARALIALSGCPLAAPSANSSGRPSPTRAQHVMEDLGDRIALVVDGGPCQWGVESTVLDGLRVPPLILRPGSVTYEQLIKYPGLQDLKVYKKDFVDASLEAAPTTPGMKYRHYSPNAAVTLLDVSSWSGSADQMRSAAAQQLPELVRSEAARLRGLIVEQKQQQQQQQQQLQQSLQQLQPQQHHSEPAVAAGKQKPWLGVLRTSLGQNIPPGLVGGVGLEANLRGMQQQQQHESAQDLHDQNSSQQQQQQQQQQPEREEGNSRSHQDTGDERFPVPDAHASLTSSVGLQGVEVVEYMLGDIADPDAVGRQLFLALRMMDTIGVDAIVVEGVREEGAGAAVMNRLRKAATRVVQLQT